MTQPSGGVSDWLTVESFNSRNERWKNERKVELTGDENVAVAVVFL